MARPFVVDANAFKLFYESIVTGDDGLAAQVVTALFRADHVLVDVGGRMIEEWRRCACGEQDDYFHTWIAARLVEDKIRKVPNKVDLAIRAHLQALGVPANDHLYVVLSAHNNAYAIISQDTDLYEPAAKTWPHSKRQKLFQSNGGCVRKYLRKTWGVLIFPVECALAHFDD